MVESKRALSPVVNRFYGTEKGRRDLKKIIMSNYYAPGAVLDVEGTRMTSTQFLPWKYPVCKNIRLLSTMDSANRRNVQT